MYEKPSNVSKMYLLHYILYIEYYITFHYVVLYIALHFAIIREYIPLKRKRSINLIDTVLNEITYLHLQR